MDLLSISKCPARAFNRSKYSVKSLKDVLIYMSFTTIQKWICYQSLNVQQEPVTDRNTAEDHERSDVCIQMSKQQS